MEGSRGQRKIAMGLRETRVLPSGRVFFKFVQGATVGIREDEH
jgi:hypothetical protein